MRPPRRAGGRCASRCAALSGDVRDRLRASGDSLDTAVLFLQQLIAGRRRVREVDYLDMPRGPDRAAAACSTGTRGVQRRTAGTSARPPSSERAAPQRARPRIPRQGALGARRPERRDRLVVLRALAGCTPFAGRGAAARGAKSATAAPAQPPTTVAAPRSCASTPSQGGAPARPAPKRVLDDVTFCVREGEIRLRRPTAPARPRCSRCWA
jgi:hypothetical protein